MFKKIINVLSVILLVFFVIIVLFSLVSRIMGEPPALFGNYIFRVSSDSMEPTLMVGDVILVRKTDADEIQKNDIITYKSNDGSMYGREVTHRVVEDPYIENDIYYYQTQGDAKGAPLDKVISYDQVEGKFICKLTLLSKIYGFISTPTGLVAFIGVIVLLFGYELVSLVISYKSLDYDDEEETEDTDKTP